VPARQARATLPATEGLPGDPWLDRWMALIERHAAGRPILELGCGGGRDSTTLAAAGHRVIGIDGSSKAIETARQHVPAGSFHCQDLRAPFPVGDAAAGVVVASLSLHYFPWTETEELVRRVRRTLMPGGLLLCRLNSTNDRHFGAIGHPAIEANYYNVDGESKRFFDRASVDRLFADGWRMIDCGEWAIDRYDHPKVAWEAVLQRDG
jgi:SAM-dependent methyltransferase